MSADTEDAGEARQLAAMLTSTAEGLRLLSNFLGRLPSDDESAMLWCAIQRHHGIDERRIEPSHL